MSSQTNGNDADQEDQAALSELELDLFTAHPFEIEPFTASKLSWQVKDTKAFSRVDGEILLDGASVPLAGDQLVMPDFTETFRLSARAGRHSIDLGQVTVQVDSLHCTTRALDNVPYMLDAGIRAKVAESPDLYFRQTLVPDPNAPNQPGGDVVVITPDQIGILLQLGKRISSFPDAAITIIIRFGLDVVEEPPRRVIYQGEVVAIEGQHVLAATNIDIRVSISFPFYVRPLLVFIQDQLRDGYNEANARANDIVSSIIDSLNGWFTPPNGFERHSVSLYVRSDGFQMCAVTFCPVPRLGTAPPVGAG